MGLVFRPMASSCPSRCGCGALFFSKAAPGVCGCGGQEARRAAIREQLIQLSMRNADLRSSILQLTAQIAVDRREVEEGERALAQLVEEERELDAATAREQGSSHVRD